MGDGVGRTQDFQHSVEECFCENCLSDARREQDDNPGSHRADGSSKADCTIGSVARYPAEDLMTEMWEVWKGQGEEDPVSRPGFSEPGIRVEVASGPQWTGCSQEVDPIGKHLKRPPCCCCQAQRYILHLPRSFLALLSRANTT